MRGEPGVLEGFKRRASLVGEPGQRSRSRVKQAIGETAGGPTKTEVNPAPTKEAELNQPTEKEENNTASTNDITPVRAHHKW